MGVREGESFFVCESERTSVKKKRELFLGFAPTCQGSFCVTTQKIFANPWELVQEFQPDSLSIGRDFFLFLFFFLLSSPSPPAVSLLLPRKHTHVK